MNILSVRHTIEAAMARKNIGKLKDLAVRLDCSERSLRGWLKGEHLPRSYNLGQISNVLDIDAHRLFAGEEDDDMERLSRRGFVFLLGAGAGATALRSWQRLDAALNSYVHIDQEAITHSIP